MGQHLKHLKDFQFGQESGLRYFMAEFGKSLRFFAYSIIRDKEAAEEIVSDTFYKLWRGRDRVKSISNAKAFLYLSTRNACYDYLDLPKKYAYIDEAAAEMIICNDADTLTQIIHAELVQLVAKEVDKLPEQQAAIFRMTYLEGLSTKEICEKLGTSSNNVYFARSKALSTLKKVFQR